MPYWSDWGLTPEAMPMLETDYLFIHQHHISSGSEQLYERLTSTSMWTQHPAVREGKVIPIPNWFVMSWTPIGRQRIMNELLNAIVRLES